MPLDAYDQTQITVILILAIVLFLFASALPQKVATITLLLLVPFQAIETRFGTSSVVLAYVVFIALLLRKEPVRLPMLPQLLFLLLWYLISMSLQHPSTYIQHAVYMFSLVSAFLVFWLSYDLTNRLKEASSIIGVFIAMNVLVSIYCAIQLWLGPGERLVLFGIHDMNMTRVRADGRLSGPFESAEITAQYFVLMQFVILHQFWNTNRGWKRRGLMALAATNLVFLITTGSRGEFLLLVGGAAVYLWLFRRRLGTMRSLRLAIGATVTLTCMALIVVNFTQFGGLFTRLERTEFNEQGIPDTRQALWGSALPQIAKNPVIGHGPRMAFFQESRGMRYENHVYIRYPHSLYLFLLFTVGIPGLILFMFVLLFIGFRCWRAMARPNAPPYFADLARTGVIVVLLFIVDGIKIEQMRFSLVDYWHFFFALCGVFVASCDRIEAQGGLGDRKSLRSSEDSKSNATKRPRTASGSTPSSAVSVEAEMAPG